MHSDLSKLSNNGRTILQMVALLALGDKLSKPALLLIFTMEHIVMISSAVAGMT